MLEKFALYVTRQRLFVVASNQSDSRYRVLKIDRTSRVGDVLPVTEDGVIYSRTEVTDLLKMIEEGNRNSGGLVRACPLFYGIVGT
jgi:phosphatidylinositol 3,5-bisphosphate 5-phosphatase